VYFTKFGAGKLARYVEREIQLHLINHAVPVALAAPRQGAQTAGANPPVQRRSRTTGGQFRLPFFFPNLFR
jgi:hypothetical protein